MKINWKAVGEFFYELLKAILTMYIIHVVVDTSNRPENVLALIVGMIFYVLFVKGDYGEKK